MLEVLWRDLFYLETWRRINNSNCLQQTITKYSNKEINFLNANIGLTDDKLVTYLFVKPIDKFSF